MRTATSSPVPNVMALASSTITTMTIQGRSESLPDNSFPVCAEALGVMRESRRRQRPQIHGRPHRYVAHDRREDKHNDETSAEGRRLERALEIGLEDTFPASDAVAIIQPGRPDLDEQMPE
jgi:hypothetical protein